MNYILNLRISAKDLNLKPTPTGIIEPTLEDLRGLFENLLQNCSQSKFPQGMKGPKVYLYNKVLKKLDSTKDFFIECSEEELVQILYDFICSDEVSVHPLQVRAYSLYRERVEALMQEKAQKARS